MYLHIGQNTVIRTQDILGIFDMETSTVSQTTRNVLARAEKAGRVVNVSFEMPEIFFVVFPRGSGDYVLYHTNFHGDPFKAMRGLGGWTHGRNRRNSRMKRFGRPQCPYCGKKVGILNTWTLRKRGEYTCPRCQGLSNVVLDIFVPLFCCFGYFGCTFFLCDQSGRGISYYAGHFSVDFGPVPCFLYCQPFFWCICAARFCTGQKNRTERKRKYRSIIPVPMPSAWQNGPKHSGGTGKSCKRRRSLSGLYRPPK